MPRRRYVEDGYYDPELELAALAPAAIGAGRTAKRAARRVGEEAWALTRGIRTRGPAYVLRRGEKEPFLMKWSPWMRILVIVGIWLAGVYVIRQLLKNWITGGVLWVLGFGVNFGLETKTMTEEQYKERFGRSPASPDDLNYTDTGQVLKNTFLNPLALMWTIIFLLLLANALPEVRYE